MKSYIVLCVFLMFQVCETSERYCRQYDYDEKMLSKMIRTEIALETLTKGMESLQSDINTKLQTIRDELETVRTKPAIQPQPSSESLTKGLESLQSDMDTKLQTIRDTLETVRTKPAIQPQPSSESLTKGLESLQSDMDTKLQTIRDELETVRTKPAIQPQPSLGGIIGFTVKSPDKTNSSNKIAIFKDVITNVGDGFNKDTGKFTCKHPGLYYFSVVILRNTGSTSYAYCYIYVNDKNTPVYAYAHSKDSGAYPSGSANLLVQLAEGDEVSLGGCEHIDKFNQLTHFSGFLVN